MDLRQALCDVAEIRAHLACTEVFRGYRSWTVGFSGVVGLAAAVAQAFWLPEPTQRLSAYLALWIGVAAVNVAVISAEIWMRAQASGSAVTRRATLFAIEQFLPSLVVGGMLTLMIFRRAGQVAWMLPGLWALVFSLGIFASCRLLPRAVSLAGLWYLACGLLALAWGQGEAALSPWLMGVPFGVGQILTAVILHLTLELPERRLD